VTRYDQKLERRLSENYIPAGVNDLFRSNTDQIGQSTKNMNASPLATVAKQYKFGTSVSWEGNRRSGVALVTDNSGITTYWLMALGREMSTPPKLQ